MSDDLKRVPARFYINTQGREPVREWLKEGLDEAERKIVGTDIKTVEYGWPIGMPLCNSLGHGIWEIRSQLKNRIARVLVCFHNEEMVLLHAFIKKTQKTPKQDFDKALERKRQLEVQDEQQ